MTEHIVAIFQDNAQATAAAQNLEQSGIPASAIRQYARDAQAGDSIERTEATTTHTATGGFWSWLVGGGDAETTPSAHASEMDSYDRSVASGSIVLSVLLTDDSQIHQAVSVLEAHHPLGIDEHTEDAEAQELPGVHPGSSTTPQTSISTAGMDYSSTAVAQPGAMTASAPIRSSAELTQPGAATPLVDAAAAATPVGHTAGSMSGRDEVITLSEEQLEVGRRIVDRGTTRIRRYVVETPVEQNVTLRDERATIERRAPTDATVTPAAAAFEERVVEVRETEEVPIVEKTARVVEEVAVNRQATERTETVRDTVRREDVEISSNNNATQ